MTCMSVVPVANHFSCCSRESCCIPDADSGCGRAAMTIISSTSMSFGWTAEPGFSSLKCLTLRTFSTCRRGVSTNLTVFGVFGNRNPEVLKKTSTCLAVSEGILNAEADLFAGWDASNVERHSEPSEGEGSVDGRQSIGETEETKAVISQFLKAKGLSAEGAACVAEKADVFTTHLLSLLHSEHRAEHISGDVLSSAQIRSTVWPHLRILSAKYGKGFADVIMSFPQVANPCGQQGDGLLLYDVTSYETGNKKSMVLNLAGYPTLLGLGLDGQLPLAVMYLLSIGLSPEQVEEVLLCAPFVAGHNVKSTIVQVVDYIVFEMGIPPSYIPRIIKKRPQLFGSSVEERLRPTVLYLEELGVGKEKWPKIMVSFPHIMTYSLAKIQDTADFLAEIGFSVPDVGKVIGRFPHIVGYSLEAKLRPICKYFESIGISDICHVIMRSPQTLGLSLECNIKTTIDFLVQLGYTPEEVSLMVSRFPQVLGLNVENNLYPKWKFYGIMRRDKSELVDFPQYFGYSLEKRIQSRHYLMLQSGLSTTLNHMLSSTDSSFEAFLSRGNSSD